MVNEASEEVTKPSCLVCSPVVWGALWSAVFWSGGLLPGTGGTPNKRNAYGAECIFSHTGRMWGPVLRPDPPKKALCSTCTFDGACNKYRNQTLVFGLPLQMFEVHFGRSCFGQRGSVGCYLCPGDFLRPRGAVSPGFYPLTESWVYCLASEAPLIKGMLTGPNVFLALPEACGLRPANGPTLKQPCAKLTHSVGYVADTWPDPRDTATRDITCSVDG